MHLSIVSSCTGISQVILKNIPRSASDGQLSNLRGGVINQLLSSLSVSLLLLLLCWLVLSRFFISLFRNSFVPVSMSLYLIILMSFSLTIFIFVSLHLFVSLSQFLCISVSQFLCETVGKSNLLCVSVFQCLCQCQYFCISVSLLHFVFELYWTLYLNQIKPCTLHDSLCSLSYVFFCHWLSISLYHYISMLFGLLMSMSLILCLSTPLCNCK